MRNDLCIVTTWQREELLWLCLEAIRANDASIPIIVFSDKQADSPELRAACKEFDAVCHVQFPPRDFYGNSWNLLTACVLTLSELPGAQFVHLIEDDTILHRGYLDWARSQLTSGEYAAVCGRIGSPHIPNWYESPCASWRIDRITTALEHVDPRYLAGTREEMGAILDGDMFPNSKYKKGGFEQDGFFLRCIEFHEWKTKFPSKALASHLGWWGYNCPSGREKPAGEFQQRIEACRAMLGNKELRRMLFGHRIADAEMEGAGL
jgi:hypothetical protein